MEARHDGKRLGLAAAIRITIWINIYMMYDPVVNCLCKQEHRCTGEHLVDSLRAFLTRGDEDIIVVWNLHGLDGEPPLKARRYGAAMA